MAACCLRFPTTSRSGDVLAKVPLSIAFRAVDTDLLVQEEAAVHLLLDMANSSSPLQLYYQTVPKRSEIWTMHSFPESYLPLVQNPPTERAIAANQDLLQETWQQHKQTLQAKLGPETSLEDLRYAMAILVTRLIETGDDGLLMVPLIDMGNHRNDCNNIHPVEPCRPGSSERCMVWRAGKPLAAGDEVCIFYKFMLQDRSLLQYGFLQSGAGSMSVQHRLSGLDRHDFKPEEPWEEPPVGEHGPLLFEGTPSAIVVELYRLQLLQSTLVKRDTEMTAAIKPHPRDENGYYLQAMLTWRQQRQEAIAAEIQRLQRQLQRLQAAEERVQQLQSLGLGLPQSAYDSFTAALQKQGAQLNVTVKSTTDTGSCNADATARGTCSSSTHPAALLAGFPPSAVFATRDVKEGDALAVMPLKHTIGVATGPKGMADIAVRFMLEMHQQSEQAAAGRATADASSGSSSTAVFWRSLYAALPPLGTVGGLYGIPPDYLRLIQDPAVETGIKAYQAELVIAWDKHRPAIEAVDRSLTLHELRHAAGLLNARLVSYEYGSFMVPLMGLASHQVNNNCPHADYLDYCPGSAAAQQAAAGQEPQQEAGAEEDDLCIVWAAGADVAAGQEVCSSYGYLMPDVALLQYGVLLQDNTTATAALAGKAERLELNAMDRHDFDPKKPFAPPKSGHEAPEPFSGTPQQALAEVSRLVMRHTNLTAIEAHHAAAAVNPSPYDRGGMLLAQMRVWRQRRIAGLEAEIERLIKSYGLDQAAVQRQVSLLVKQQEEWQAQAAAAKQAAAEAKAAGASSAAAPGINQGTAAVAAAAAAAAAGSGGQSDHWQDMQDIFTGIMHDHASQ
uniref:SET domain-containing protein n=1 Tax=Tetradesmus obliquus TaxID=3088 RepID=A0A383VR40_TETOB|eukprot:jgi/Sobl393_1/5152/SZX67985.1